MILKIYLKKDFKRLEWSFIKDALNFFGFPPNLIKLFISYISSASILILINGSKSTKFRPTKVIIQGDPISLYLFILCIERLSREIDSKICSKAWKPISITHQGPFISYLFFVDDLTLFARATLKAC